MIDKDDITVIDRYVAQGSAGGFLHGAWSRIRAELVASGFASANSAMDATKLREAFMAGRLSQVCCIEQEQAFSEFMARRRHQ